MSAAGALGRSCSVAIFVLAAFLLPWISMVPPGKAASETSTPAKASAPAKTSPQTEPSVPTIWNGEKPVTLDELKHHASEIGDLLDQASARVEYLAVDAPEQPSSKELVAAIRQELELSRRWNRHLTSILLEVTEARQALNRREHKAAAEIYQLTSIAEEARLELIALWKTLRPGMAVPFGEHDLGPTSKPAPKKHPAPAPKMDKLRIEAVTEGIAGSEATIDEARQVLDEMGAVQETAAGDIDAVRSKIIEALRTLAPHRTTPLEDDVPSGARIEGSLSSKEITAWAASIASELRHEEFKEANLARDRSDATRISIPNIEKMTMRSETLSTAAVRIAPDRRARAIATVLMGNSILVTGKVIDRDWYRVETGDGRHGFVSSDLVRPKSMPLAPMRQAKSS